MVLLCKKAFAELEEALFMKDSAKALSEKNHFGPPHARDRRIAILWMQVNGYFCVSCR
jgi:hypothetical protein